MNTQTTTQSATTFAAPQMISSPRQRFRRFATGVLVALFTLGFASPALAHDELTGFEVLSAADSEIVEGFSLNYSSEILDVGTEILATDEIGAEVLSGLPKVDGRIVTQELITPLSAGKIEIAWRVVSSDGHPISGALVLTVNDDGTGTIAEVAATTNDEGTVQATDTSSLGDDAAADRAAPNIWIIIAVALAAIAAAGSSMVLVMRRRGGGNNNTNEHPDSAGASDDR